MIEIIKEFIIKESYFEYNTPLFREVLVSRLHDLIEETKLTHGAYKIICDETLNTPDLIDENKIKLNIEFPLECTWEFTLHPGKLLESKEDDDGNIVTTFGPPWVEFNVR